MFVATVSQILEDVNLNVASHFMLDIPGHSMGMVLYNITPQVQGKSAWNDNCYSHDAVVPLTGCLFWALPSSKIVALTGTPLRLPTVWLVLLICIYIALLRWVKKKLLEIGMGVHNMLSQLQHVEVAGLAQLTHVSDGHITQTNWGCTHQEAFKLHVLLTHPW